ncbi:MAG: tetratricopeptide repeat protein, partial [Planctomycetota bacterium]
RGGGEGEELGASLLEQHRQQIEIARQIAAIEPSEPLWQQLVEQLQSSFARVEIEVLAARCRRFPTAVDIRYQLAQRLRRLGNLPEAQRYLQEVVDLAGTNQWNWRLAALGDLGEYRQRLRQFPAALELYRRALQGGSAAAEDRTASPFVAESGPDAGEERCRVLRRAAVLAEALGLAPEAIRYWRELVARSPADQESAGRLDKLLRIDDNSQSD